MPLTSHEIQVLDSLSNVFFASLDDDETSQLIAFAHEHHSDVDDKILQAYSKRSALSMRVLDEIVKTIENDLPIEVFNEIKLALSLLSTSWGTLLLAGQATPFPQIPVKIQAQIVFQWGSSWIPNLRALHRAIKGITLKICYSSSKTGHNANWPVIGYPGPDPESSSAKFKESTPHSIEILDIGQEDLYTDALTGSFILKEEFDAVIVGSGCGGGVAASELCKRGLKVIVVDKGVYKCPSELSLLEDESMRLFYEGKGLLTTTDGSMSVFAGSCFGGGSTINWACSLRPPHYVKEEWAQCFGLDALSPDFANSIEAVCNRIGAKHEKPVFHDEQNKILIKGCRAMGLNVSEAPQNTKSGTEHQCGWCCFGCKYTEKQGTLATFLSDAQAMGAKFLDHCKAMKIGMQANKATGVFVEHKNRSFFIRSRSVIVSAGALNTPLLLKRSGFTNPFIGNNLRLHPVTVVFGRFDRDIEGWKGAMMTAVAEISSDDSYGAKLECPIAHPGVLAGGSHWDSPLEHKKLMLMLKRFASIIVLVRDRGSGSVREGVDGSPRISYSLSPKDTQSMLKGVRAAASVLVSAGAKEIFSCTQGFPSFKVGELGLGDPNFSKWLDDFERIGIVPNRTGIFSAHQMGTAKMGIQPESSATDLNGRLWETGNVYVCDTSLFPTPSGANPMVTCLSLAHYVSQRIADKLCKSPNRKSKM